MNKQAGFTLIELMIVVAIIGIIASVAIPSYKDYVNTAEGGSALRSLLPYVYQGQTCVSTGSGCTALNLRIGNTTELTEIANSGKVQKDTAATLEWNNSTCKVRAIIGANGSINYDAESVDTSKASHQNCKDGAGLVSS
jgi:prepilin-type N-terminal cleavage/methylation domain-containing protein